MPKPSHRSTTQIMDTSLQPRYVCKISQRSVRALDHSCPLLDTVVGYPACSLPFQAKHSHVRMPDRIGSPNIIAH